MKPVPDVRLVLLPEVLDRLGGISPDTFARHWQEVFTPRRGARNCRAVLSDELDVAVVEGAAAVLTYRRSKGRMKGAA